MSSFDGNLAEILDGLEQEQKSISPKFFYDEQGSRLFDEITTLPEYYLTQTEIRIMLANIGEIRELVGKQASLIEFGSGSSMKTRILLENLDELAAYVPVDISEEHLLEAARQIGDEFPGIEVLPVVADFTRPFDLPTPKVMPLKNIVYFPGSTIGNFTRDAATGLLEVMRHEARDEGALLIGVDLQKDAEIIENAYNDSAGVTAEFNLNVLRHLNREYGTDFDIDAFSHDARYDEDEGRVVISLISDRQQAVNVGDQEIEIGVGEAILTEYSHKYTLDGFAAMARECGFAVESVWTDADNLFSVQYLTAV
ncbi:MAG: L-histidine N(alpha)-methyltransferase [Woeseiaceae bacterium]